MNFTIAAAAERTGLTTHTLRYYEKEGLLPFVDRSDSGIRVFKESDFEWLSLITCLKGTGMPIKEIKQFIDLCLQGDATLEQRLELFLQHKKAVQEKIDEMQRHMNKIDYKIWYYQTAAEAGTEAVHKKTSCETA